MISMKQFIGQKYEKLSLITIDIIRNNWKSYSLLLFVFVLMYTVYGQNNDIPLKITLVLFFIGIFLISILL